MPCQRVALPFEQLSCSCIDIADRATERDTYSWRRLFDQLTRPRFSQSKQQHTNATTTIRWMHTGEHLDVRGLALPDTCVTNELPTRCDYDPGISLQIKARPLPIGMYFLPGIIRQTMVRSVAGHHQCSNGIQ